MERQRLFGKLMQDLCGQNGNNSSCHGPWCWVCVLVDRPPRAGLSPFLMKQPCEVRGSTLLLLSPLLCLYTFSPLLTPHLSLPTAHSCTHGWVAGSSLSCQEQIQFSSSTGHRFSETVERHEADWGGVLPPLPKQRSGLTGNPPGPGG